MPKEADTLVKQSNAMARGKLDNHTNSPWGERIIALFASRIRTSDSELNEYQIPISKLGITRNNLTGYEYRKIKAAMIELARATYTVEEGRNFEVYSVFAWLKYRDGILTGKFNEDMKAHLLLLTENFTLYEFREFRLLRTSYAQQMFRFLKSWGNLDEVTIPLVRLHKAFGVTTSLKKNYAFFRRRVLEASHDEIFEKTSFRYAWEALKTKNKVTSIRFIFREVKVLGTRADDEDFTEFQTKSNKCFEKLQRIGKECCPRPRSKTCRYCQERGRMHIKRRSALAHMEDATK
jgi:plasmid replication initiation protein